MESNLYTKEQEKKQYQKESYKLLFWNILCDQYSYDWKTSPKIELKYKIWEYREKLFKKLFSSQSTYSDVYCFVEVDKYNEIYEMINSVYNNIYQCLYFPRPNTPLGILLLFNTNKFNILYYTKFYLGANKNQNFALFSVLQEKAKTNNIFGVVITHLIAWEKHENIRIQQVNNLMWNLYHDKYILTYGLKNIFLCGDFNAMPKSQCISIIEMYNFITVFNNFDDNDNNYTIVIDTYDEGLKKLKFDYIFYKGNINIVNKYLPSEYLNFEIGMPNENFPSDHIFLQTEFEFI